MQLVVQQLVLLLDEQPLQQQQVPLQRPLVLLQQPRQQRLPPMQQGLPHGPRQQEPLELEQLLQLLELLSGRLVPPMLLLHVQLHERQLQRQELLALELPQLGFCIQILECLVPLQQVKPLWLVQHSDQLLQLGLPP